MRFTKPLPRGLQAHLARKYGYSRQNITKIVQGFIQNPEIWAELTEAAEEFRHEKELLKSLGTEQTKLALKFRHYINSLSDTELFTFLTFSKYDASSLTGKGDCPP